MSNARLQTSERIARLRPIELDGRCWYALEDVCAALRVQRKKCAGLVAEEHRRRYTQFRRGYRSRRIGLIDRAGKVGNPKGFQVGLRADRLGQIKDLSKAPWRRW